MASTFTKPESTWLHLWGMLRDKVYSNNYHTHDMKKKISTQNIVPASWRKPFPAASLNTVIETLTLTTIYWNKTCGPLLIQTEHQHTMHCWPPCKMACEVTKDMGQVNQGPCTTVIQVKIIHTTHTLTFKWLGWYLHFSTWYIKKCFIWKEWVKIMT